jgi:hypothetical protein
MPEKYALGNCAVRRRRQSNACTAIRDLLTDERDKEILCGSPDLEAVIAVAENADRGARSLLSGWYRGYIRSGAHRL